MLVASVSACSRRRVSSHIRPASSTVPRMPISNMVRGVLFCNFPSSIVVELTRNRNARPPISIGSSIDIAGADCTEMPAGAKTRRSPSKSSSVTGIGTFVDKCVMRRFRSMMPIRKSSRLSGNFVAAAPTTIAMRDSDLTHPGNGLNEREIAMRPETVAAFIVSATSATLRQFVVADAAAGNFGRKTRVTALCAVPDASPPPGENCSAAKPANDSGVCIRTSK